MHRPFAWGEGIAHAGDYPTLGMLRQVTELRPIAPECRGTAARLDSVLRSLELRLWLTVPKRLDIGEIVFSRVGTSWSAPRGA